MDERRIAGTKVFSGVEVRTNRNKFRVVRLHYTADPHKATDDWYNNTRPGMPEDKWEQEYEINFNVLHGKRFYNEFDYERHSAALKFNPNLTMLRGWDFGYHYPACVWAQIDLKDRLNVYREEMGCDEALINFAKRVVRISTQEFPGCKFKDFADPAGKQSSDKSERTSVDILRGLGVRPQMRKTERILGFNIMRNLMLRHTVLPDGTKTPSYIIDKKCTVLIDGYMGGYHYPETKDGKPQKEDPSGGGFYEHLQDALRYILICLFRPNGTVYHNIRPFYRIRKSVSQITGY